MHISSSQTSSLSFNTPKFSYSRPIKSMYVLALLLSGSLLNLAKETTSLKERKVQNTHGLLAIECKSMENSLVSSIFTRTWQQLQDTDALASYVNFISDELLPSCNASYQKFSPRFASFVDTGSFMLNEGEKAGQMGCRINREFKKSFSCKEKFLKADKILVKAQANKGFKASKEYFVSLGNRLNFQPISGNKAEYQAHQQAIAYVQKEMLQSPNFFQKSEEQILSVIKKTHQLLAQNQNIANPGEYRNKAMIVNTFGSDFNAMRDFLIKEYKPLDPAELEAFNEEIKIFDESVLMYKKMGLARAVKYFSKIEEKVWKKIIAIPLNATHVPAAMEDLVKKFKNYHLRRIHPLAIAAWLHCALVEIHPFEDGNGRTARLLMNAYLVFNGYQPVAFPNKLMYANAVRANNESPGFFAKYLVSVMHWNRRNIQNIN